MEGWLCLVRLITLGELFSFYHAIYSPFKRMIWYGKWFWYDGKWEKQATRIKDNHTTQELEGLTVTHKALPWPLSTLTLTSPPASHLLLPALQPHWLPVLFLSRGLSLALACVWNSLTLESHMANCFTSFKSLFQCHLLKKTYSVYALYNSNVPPPARELQTPSFSLYFLTKVLLIFWQLYKFTSFLLFSTSQNLIYIKAEIFFVLIYHKLLKWCWHLNIWQMNG